MCHFHQRSIVKRYITQKPKLQASKDLKKIMCTLTKTNEKIFTKKLDLWYKKHKNFINERTINIDTNKTHYTHQKLRSAYRSLRTNLPYLFTYKNNPNLDIHNTTNSLDGGVFSPMKMLMKIHRGSSKSLRLKMVDVYLVNYNKKL
jgi:hypothetical protein